MLDGQPHMLQTCQDWSVAGVKVTQDMSCPEFKRLNGAFNGVIRLEEVRQRYPERDFESTRSSENPEIEPEHL